MSNGLPLPPPPMRWWRQRVDPFCSTDSRWSFSSGPIRSHDLGDFLVSKLQESARSMDNDKPIAGWSKKLLERLGDYESESRLLIKLADTGRVIELLKHGIETTLHILHIYNSETRKEWLERLQEEREIRVARYEDLLSRHEDLVKEMGDEELQLQVLTWMKHDFNRFGSVLTDGERDVMLAIFDALVLQTNTVIVELPNWFATSPPDNSQKTYIHEGEEACLRQATILASLNHHPNVQTFYGACHVGKAFILLEIDHSGSPTWSFFLGCALGLEYMHRRGFICKALTNRMFTYSADGKRGVLSGLSLERVQRKGDKAGNYNQDSDIERKQSDVRALILTIFVIVAQSRGITDFASLRELPKVKPDFLNMYEWRLLELMWNTDSSDNISMSDVVRRMKGYVKRLKEREEMDDQPYPEIDESEPEPALNLVENIQTYVISVVEQTIPEILDEVGNKLCDISGNNLGYRIVYERLQVVKEQLINLHQPLPAKLVDNYAIIVLKLHKILDKMTDEYDFSLSLQSSAMSTNQMYDLHLTIDEMIYTNPHFLKRVNLYQCRRLEGLELSSISFNCLGGVARDRSTLYIPMDEVQRKACVGRGAFGSAHFAEWLGTSVVMKRIDTIQHEQYFQNQFIQEAELWLKLNHKHLIHLYGVNNTERRPFFICERATGGTLIKFLHPRSQEHVDTALDLENPQMREISFGNSYGAYKSGNSRLRECLIDAAMGLENLHESGIVHGDIKGDNILVCYDKHTRSTTAKVADFGLSTFVKHPGPNLPADALGAIRWKAPECLQGNLPTQEADVFAFGMCFIEAATGRFPWGDIPECIVRLNVVSKRMLPPRPNEMDTSLWALVKRMCHFDPRKRINMSAVVNILINGETKDTTRSTTIDRAPHPPRINRWRRNNRLPNMDRTPDRLGDYLVALRNNFVATNSSCRRGLNLSGELKAYENEKRVLLKLASTGRVVNILQRFGRVVESYMKVMNIEMTEEVRQWSYQLDIERQERVQLFREILNEERFIEFMGDETQQMELLTLLQHDLTHYEKLLAPEELDIISDVYDRVVNYSEIVLVGGLPSWFLSPNDLLCEQGGICYLDSVRVSKCETGEVLRSFGEHQHWEDQEEACLRQATVWADLNHPHVAKLLGACHTGKEPYVVHEPAEPLVSNRANAQSWEPILGWALGLQYLHERELGYKNFDDTRLMARHHVTASGVLSGLGLVPVNRKVSAPLQRGVSNMINLIDLAVPLPQNDEDSLHDWHAPTWSVPSDIFAFGMAIYNTRQWVSMYSDEKVAALPHECPLFLREQEWELIQNMCSKAPERRVTMWYVVHQLQAFVKARELEVDKGPPVDLGVWIDLDDQSKLITEDACTSPEFNDKVAKAMCFLQSLYNSFPRGDNNMLEHVIDRLSDVHALLQTPEYVKNIAVVMEGFVSVLDLVYNMLTRRDLGKEQSSSSLIANFCSSRTAAQNYIIFHHEIDRLLTLAELRDSSSAPTHVTLADIHEDSTDFIDTGPDLKDIHNWQVKWNKMRREQLRAFQVCLKNTEGLQQQLSDPQDRFEARMLLQFELHKRRSSYPNSVLEAIVGALKVLESIGDGAEGVPSWFIPPYEVVLGKYIARGGFGDVYYGKWFDTEVVVKIPKPQTLAASSGKASPPTSSSEASEEDAMELFRREADHWFMLNHQNVVHLYGACHVGTPFFVCEPAKSTSLNAHIKSLACAKPGYNYEENGGDPSDIMHCLFLAGIGLKYLHERGIVHCDLKGNNFMVGIDGKTIKLGGFGMSALKRSGKSRHSAHANVGAVPWKAPEYLKGDDPTVMSDIYGFGMCILELFSGSIPWSGVPEAVVKFHVTKRKALPPRPKKLNDFQWSLIRHMCCYEPNERISLDAVVDLLHTFRFG